MKKTMIKQFIEKTVSNVGTKHKGDESTKRPGTKWQGDETTRYLAEYIYCLAHLHDNIACDD